ncbi:MAG: sigma-54-dependent transcriptional regulator [Planctomycetota bacterium]
MGLFEARDLGLVRAVSDLVYVNPFLPERITLERAALGEDFEEREAQWNLVTVGQHDPVNVQRLLHRARAVAGAARTRLADAAKPTPEELVLYEDLCLFLLYYESRDQFLLIQEGSTPSPSARAVFREFLVRATELLDLTGARLSALDDLPHLFAVFFQVRRAFHQISLHITGRSAAASRLRAVIWQSIFTHDMRRYRRSLYERMGDVATLITGPSGTGKELVARAIGLSRYLPFDPQRGGFDGPVDESFHALNLPALSPTLIESELFGHSRGSFTGASADHAGWFEVCPARGSVFLDEIGDLDPSLQVKLLRVLQTRTFQRLGETTPRRFVGKVIAATNRDLASELTAGRFREDLFYRLCADHVVTPSLRQHLDDDPDELPHLVEFIARRMVGEEAPALTDEVVSWIRGNLDSTYPWRGNFRELEQCVRSVLVRREYHPIHASSNAASTLGRDVDACALTADQLLQRYCRLVYQRAGSYEGAARILDLDRRTVKAKTEGAEEARE